MLIVFAVARLLMVAWFGKVQRQRVREKEAAGVAKVRETKLFSVLCVTRAK